MAQHVVDLIPDSPSKNLSFSDALIYLKRGHLLARAGWNGKDLYVHFMKDPIEVEFDEDDNTIETTTEIQPFFILISPNGANTWVPSVSDILATDWMILK